MEQQQSQENSRSRFGKIIHAMFNYKAWIDLERSRSITHYFIEMFRKFFIPQKNKMQDAKSFEDVVKEMDVSEDDLQEKVKSFRKMYLIMLIGAFLFYAYSMYQLLYGGVLSVILAFIISLVCLTLAFRYHFWCFQIKKRKLGCSIKEWFKASFMGGDQ